MGNADTPSLPSLSGPLLPGVGVPDRVWSMGPIKLNCVLMENWITWNRTVFDIETVLMLNQIIWNRIVYMYKNEFGIK